MTFTLRQRIVLLFAPALSLLVGIGGAGVWLLHDLGRRSEEIIRDNYVSIRLMTEVAAESNAADYLGLGVATGADAADARQKLRATFGRIRELVERENGNITVPGEAEAARKLTASAAEAARRADTLTDLPPAERYAFFEDDNPDGFQSGLFAVRVNARFIYLLNEEAMYEADRASRDAARRSSWLLGVAAGLSLLATGVLAWRLGRAILGPIEAVTDAATAIGGGQLHLTVPELSRDEIGRLAAAFNAMTRRLRDYRQSDTERLLRARQTGQATIDSFPDPIVVLDTLGRVEVANPTAQRLLGVRPPRDGEPLVTWTPPESLRQAVDDALRQQRVVEKAGFDQAVTFRLDGEDRVYLPQVRPIRSPEGELLGAAVALDDVTRFRLLDRLKSDWVATVSHELKTPLTSVRLAVHVLLEEAVGPLEPKQVELLVEARESTERLLKLIEHLLSLAKLEDGRERLDLRRTEPADLLRAAADEAATRAEDKHVEIVVEDAPDVPPVTADATRLGRALNNLLDNAVTHTESGGKVTLTATAAGDRVRLSVSDTGVGIPADSLPHVFDRFFRVPGRDSTPGTGLGLAIVREIVTAHGGDITCESKPGYGTTFHITLPASGVRE